jgi:hypothetical protein
MGTLKVPVTQHDHIQGPANAPVTLVEYGDFECPGCGAAHPIVKLVLRHFGRRLRFVFRHFPLTQVHPNAEPAAECPEGQKRLYRRRAQRRERHSTRRRPLPNSSKRVGVKMRLNCQDQVLQRVGSQVLMSVDEE